MKLKIKEIEILQDDPFKNDALDRKYSAEVLTNILLSVDEPFVLSVDSQWGTGKTTFIKMWKQYLDNQNIPSLYYNAWENDFVDDPLISLISEIENGIQTLDKVSVTKKRIVKKFSKVKKIGGKLIRKALPTAIKVATYGALDISESFEDSIADFTEGYAENLIKDYEESKKSLEAFRHELSNFINELRTIEKFANKPLIIFIDELDRCRPTFAIELLERAKHLFNISGIVFVLSVDKEQLSHSISTIYGINMNSKGYLKRFIDLEYNLPDPNKEVFMDDLFNRFEMSSYFVNRPQEPFKNDWNDIKYVFKKLAELFNLPLREQIQLFGQVCLTLRMTPNTFHIFPYILVFLIVLRYVNRGLYDSFIVYAKNGSDIYSYFNKQPKFTAFEKEPNFVALIENINYITYTKSNYTIHKKYRELLQGYIHEGVEQKANTVLNSLPDPNGMPPNQILQSIVKKIEMSEKFQN